MNIVVFIWLLLLLSCAATAPALSLGPPESAPEGGPTAATDKPVDMSEYFEGGMNGGRGGLPEVTLWFKSSQQRLVRSGAFGWSPPKSPRPENMNYDGWRWWHLGISDALLQLIFDQATDPSGAAAKLGPYFSHLHDSSTTCWSETPRPPAGLVLDLSKDVAITESFRSDHYIIYGITNRLFFNGSAKFLITVDHDKHITAQLLSSTLPSAATKNLQLGIESLGGHPVLSFPISGAREDSIQFIAEFAIERKPGLLKKAGLGPESECLLCANQVRQNGD